MRDCHGPPRRVGGRLPRRLALMALAVLLAVLVQAPGAYAQRRLTTPKPAEIESHHLPPEDPFEGLNRKFYAVHRFLDRLILRPLALGYAAILPKPLRSGIHNVVAELGEPVVFANDLA